MWAGKAGSAKVWPHYNIQLTVNHSGTYLSNLMVDSVASNNNPACDAWLIFPLSHVVFVVTC